MNQVCYYECGREATGVIQERYMCAPCYLDQEERHEKIRAARVKPYQNNRPQYMTRSPAFDVLEAQPIGSVIRELRELRERRLISQLSSEESSSSEEEDISDVTLQEALDNYEYSTRLLGRARETYGEDHPEYYRAFNIYCRAIHTLTRVRRESI